MPAMTLVLPKTAALELGVPATWFEAEVNQGRQVPAIRVRTRRPAGPVTDGGTVPAVPANSPVMAPVTPDPPSGAPPVDDDEIPF